MSIKRRKELFQRVEEIFHDALEAAFDLIIKYTDEIECSDGEAVEEEDDSVESDDDEESSGESVSVEEDSDGDLVDKNGNIYDKETFEQIGSIDPETNEKTYL